MSQIDCIKCKGRYYTKPMTCGHSYCPIYSKVYQFKTTRLEKQEFVGTAPSVFVGRMNYPNLNVGIMAPPDTVQEEPELYDAPKQWSKRGFHIEDVMSFRGALINSRFQSHIKSKTKYLEMTQEVALSSKPVDIEFKLEKKPKYWIKTSDFETVMGASASLVKARFNSTPKIDHKVEYIVSDDLKSVEQMTTLYQKGFDETFLTRILSTGNLGLSTQKKLVPTRWSITAVDDTLGKNIIREIKEYKEAEYQIYFGGYMGNFFLFLIFPRVWSYELFEMYMPSTLLNPNRETKYTTDFELYNGRKQYADETAGVYYACRLGVVEQLKKMKKQATVVALRFITDEYSMPLGVWVVREASRNAFQKGIKFNSEKEMIEYVKGLIITRFNFNIDSILKESKVLNHIRSQRTIMEFF